MAETRVINIDINNNADETEKDLKNLNQELNNTAEANDEVAKSFDKSSTFADRYGDETETLSGRLGQATDRLYELALAGDTASDEYRELIEEAGRLRQTQVETDLAIEGQSQTFSQKLGPAIQGVTSGFSVAQGAMALFGSENEALNESLLKVQAALAIQQGVEGLQQSYKQLGAATKIASATQAVFSAVVGTTSGALKVFRLALISTGIGAIVVGLGLLIANFDKVTKAIEPVIQGLKDFGDAIGLTNFAEEEQAEERQKRFEQEKKRIEELKRAQQVAFDIRQKQFDLEIRKAKLLGKETIEIEKQKIQASIEFQKQKAKELELVLKESEDFINAQIKGTSKTSNLIRAIQKGRQEQVKELKQLNIDIADSELTLKDLIINYNKEKADSYRSYADERKSIARQIEDLENDLLKDGLEKELEINRDKFRRLREDAEGNAEEQVRLRELYTEQEAKAEAEIRDKFRKEALKEEIDFFNENKLPVLQAQADEEVEVEITKWSLIGQAQKKAFDEEKARRKEINAFVAETAMQTLDVVNQFAQLRADKFESLNQQILDNEELTDKQKEKMLAENNKKAKRAFEIQKAANIAQAVISTYQGANAIFASGFGGSRWFS
jgi:hypothetical protein